jgi:hypothetical protein
MRTGTGIVLILLAGIALFGVPFVAYFQKWAGEDVTFNEAECSRIAAEVVDGKLVPDTSGLVVLPAPLANATSGGVVYVTRKSGELLLVLFPMWRGHDSNMGGYLFCSRPLTKADPPMDALARNNGEIEIMGPGVWYFHRRPRREHSGHEVIDPGGQRNRTKHVGPVGVTVERRVKPQWYYVFYNLD